MQKFLCLDLNIIMKIYGLKYPPLKSKSLPEHLIYHQATGRHEVTGEIVDRFIMFSLKKGEERVKAIIECMKTTVDRDGVKNVPSVYIKNLMSPFSGLGLGTELLDFARVYSKKHGCNGFIHLFSSAGYTPNRIPHIFYRKYGMNTENASINRRLDKFISQGKTADHYDFSDVNMFYPPIKNPITTWQQILNFLGFGG